MKLNLAFFDVFSFQIILFLLLQNGSAIFDGSLSSSCRLLYYVEFFSYHVLMLFAREIMFGSQMVALLNSMYQLERKLFTKKLVKPS